LGLLAFLSNPAKFGFSKANSKRGFNPSASPNKKYPDQKSGCFLIHGGLKETDLWEAR
jgi:hypothetical protein